MSAGDGPLLHLKLDDVFTDAWDNHDYVRDSGRARDEAGQPLTGKLPDGASLVPDDMFGSCLHIPDEISIPLVAPSDASFGSGFTFEIWVNRSETAGGAQYLMFRNENKFVQFYGDPAGGQLHFNDSVGWTDLGTHVVDGWTHIAVTLDADGTAIAYSNGEACSAPTECTAVDLSGWVPVVGGGGVFGGKMAHVRVYDRVLDAAEIKADMARDAIAVRSFEALHPLAFRLLDEEQRGVIYVHEPGRDHPLTVEVTNESPRPIVLSASTATVSAEHHHFELLFRSGVLSAATVAAIAAGQALAGTDWSVVSKEHPLNGTVSLYLLKTSGHTLAGTDPLTENDTLSVTIDPLSAAVTGGARTTPVELRPGPLTSIHETTGESALRPGGRLLTLEIVSHRGLRYIPLHVGFITANTVLNDGATPNDLLLRVKNVSHDKAIPIKIDGENATHFTLEIENGPARAKGWALANNLNGINVHLSRQPEYPEVAAPLVDGKWIIGADQLSQLYQVDVGHGLREIASQESLYIHVRNITTNHHTGPSTLTLSYSDVPGYWDDAFQCTVQKSPLIYENYNVGIGTRHPTSRLSVKGGVAIGTTYSEGISAAGPNDLIVEGSVGIGTAIPTNRLAVAGGADLGGDLNMMGNINMKGSTVLRFDEQTGDRTARFGWGTQSPARGYTFPSVKYSYPDVQRPGVWLTSSSAAPYTAEGGLFFDDDGLVIFNSAKKDLLRVWDATQRVNRLVVKANGTTYMPGGLDARGASVWGNTRLAGKVDIDLDLDVGGRIEPSYKLEALPVKTSMRYTQSHWLGCIPRFVQIFFSTDKAGTALHSVGMFNYGYDNGCAYMLTDDVIHISTGDENVCLGAEDVGGKFEYSHWTSGYYWIYIWK